jgi:copper chaperone CopZ
MLKTTKFALAAALLALGAAAAAQTPATTTIHVNDLHCAGCAKRVVKTVTEVPGVGAAQADVKAATVTVTPQAQKAPSPRQLWEAVEKAGFKPTKLTGPSGTFAEKPQT